MKDALPHPANMYIDRATLRLKNLTEVIIGLYVIHLERWLKYFPRTQLKVIDGDLFRKGRFG